MPWPWSKQPRKPALEAAKQAFIRGGRAVQEGRYQDAVIDFEKAAELAPMWAEAHINAGSLGYQLAVGSADSTRELWLSRAKTHFESALRLQPTSLPASLNLAATLNAQGQADEALRVLESLAEDHADSADVQYNLALAYLESGRREQAARHLAEALRLVPEHAAAQALRDRLAAE